VNESSVASAPRRFARWSALVGLVIGLVIVPWLIWGTQLETWVAGIIAQREPPAYFDAWVIGLLLADVFLPVPSSIVAVASGVFLGTLRGSIAVFVGLTLGSLLGYGFGAKWGPGAARRLVGEAEWQRSEQWARRFGSALVLVLRPVPVLAEASTFYAGATRVPFYRYLLACCAGNAVIAVVYASVGSLSADSGDLEPALMAGFLLPGIAMLSVKYFAKKLG
jgi:3-dehydroquinate synthase